MNAAKVADAVIARLSLDYYTESLKGDLRNYIIEEIGKEVVAQQVRRYEIPYPGRE